MSIIEMFESIQGEGQYIGTPSIFIRFSGCNLKCSWCDTKYSWTEKGKYTWKDAIRFIKENSLYKHIVFTGGEPLLSKNQEDIMRIIQNTMIVDSRITIETNGIILPYHSLQLLMKIRGLWSVSPKLQFLEKYNLNTLRYFDSIKNHQ